MTKPFSPSELVARVKSPQKRYKRIKGEDNHKNVLEFNDLLIDKDLRRVYILDKEVTFTSMEFNLLYFLASNPNIMFSKDRLFRKLWDEADFDDIDTVAVHLQKLRKRLLKSKVHWNTLGQCSGYRFNINN